MNSIRVTSLLAVVMVITASGCASTKSTPDQAPRTFSESARFAEVLVSSPQFSNAFWGIRILRLDTGSELYSRNSGSSLVPASNTKLYTTAAAIDQLGAQFQFVTTLVTDGTISNSTLVGDLIVRGSGDPSISGRFNDGDELAIFRAWAAQLKGLGVSRIAGNIIGDDDLFDDIPLGYGWSWDDEKYWYSAEISALTFNDNCIDLLIKGTQPGEPGVISWAPNNSPYVTVQNRTMTVSDPEMAGESYERDRASNNFVIASTLEPGETVRESLSVSNPTSYFVTVLRSVLIENGIAVDGYAVDIDDLETKPDASSLDTLIQHRSPPLRELAAVVNKQSHNLYAEQILRVLADRQTAVMQAADEDESTASVAIEKAAATWNSAGIDTSRIQLVDGSGLSRYNFVTAKMTTQLLSYMWHGTDNQKRSAFLDSLPIGGIDGTIARRFQSADMRGRVRAKTGTVSNVSSLSGFVTTDSGIPLAFSIMANNFTVETDSVRAVQDAIVTAFAHSAAR